jgi:hypothetical protein
MAEKITLEAASLNADNIEAKPTFVTHQITTMKELADIVTVENVKRLSDDVAVWLHTIAGLKPYGISSPETIVWTDDGNAEAITTLHDSNGSGLTIEMKTTLENATF